MVYIFHLVSRSRSLSFFSHSTITIIVILLVYVPKIWINLKLSRIIRNRTCQMHSKNYILVTQIVRTSRYECPIGAIVWHVYKRQFCVNDNMPFAVCVPSLFPVFRFLIDYFIAHIHLFNSICMCTLCRIQRAYKAIIGRPKFRIHVWNAL